MTSEEVYYLLRMYLGNVPNVSIVSSEYDQVNFGNFAIQVAINQSDKLIICDRDQLVICDGLSGVDNCQEIASSIREINDVEILQELKAYMSNIE